MILLSPENPPSFCTLMPPAKAKQFSWTYTRKTLSLVRRTILRAERVLWKIIKVLKWKMPTPTQTQLWEHWNPKADALWDDVSLLIKRGKRLPSSQKEQGWKTNNTRNENLAKLQKRNFCSRNCFKCNLPKANRKLSKFSSNSDEVGNEGGKKLQQQHEKVCDKAVQF